MLTYYDDISAVLVLHILTSYKYFFLGEVVQANKSSVITYDSFGWTTIHREKYVYEVEFYFNVLIEAPGRW